MPVNKFLSNIPIIGSSYVFLFIVAVFVVSTCIYSMYSLCTIPSIKKQAAAVVAVEKKPPYAARA